MEHYIRLTLTNDRPSKQTSPNFEIYLRYFRFIHIWNFLVSMIKQLHLNNLDYFFWEIEFEIDNYLGKLPCGQPNEHCFKHKTLVLSQGGKAWVYCKPIRKMVWLFCMLVSLFILLHSMVEFILFYFNSADVTAFVNLKQNGN